MRILIVEDEVRLAEAISEIVKEEKYDSDMVYTGVDGLYYASSEIYDCIILDVMLPEMDGFEVLKEIRKKGIETPILMLTARDEVKSKVKGLDYGADDYMTKPFDVEELLARIRAITRRKGQVILDELKFEDLVLDLNNYSISTNFKSINLTAKEFEIIKLLMSNANIVVTKDDLISKIWGYDSDAEDNNVEVYISFIRKKLKFIKSKVEITTLRKLGYKLEYTG
ncbi:response regulator transcription factor [Mediannikoviicoccus vaginalis]|uniref:response regulator transcription factor n=1 Tax=Mediannikoviicoccus vaginalis TaxID=2899727 RepID=UPI001F19DD7E|nr:response regulator transcription factor [Mediannikoviicoccus vaginalis]